MLLPFSILAQTKNGVISGVVASDEGGPLPAAYIYLENTNFYTETDNKGYYKLSVPSGKYQLICHFIGYEKKSVTVNISPGQKIVHNFKLNHNDQLLQEVKVTGKSLVKEVKESAYNVVAIDAKTLENSSMDLSQAMERSSGIRIRRSGGQGSRTSVMLNGFTGRHVKVFMDGIPMNSFGSAFQINNIPINIADRIEIYKGVVPIELGADALGGAINIVTKKTANTYLDASYSYGSFNTHKTNVNFGSTLESGLSFTVNVFQNYSDNNYKVKTNLLNLETNTYSTEEYWFERFHDTYRNETVIGKVGVQQKPWADRFLIGATLAQEKADIQNSNLMKIVFGGRTRKATTVMPSLEYIKHGLFTKKLSVSVAANYSMVRNVNADTLARQYNWLGEYRIKGSKGEGDYTLGKFRNNSGLVNSNLRFEPDEKHLFAINNVWSSFSRKSTDEKAVTANSTEADFIKRTNIKDVLGVSYMYKPNEKWSISAFGKEYFVRITGPVDTSSTTTPKYASQTRRFNTTGYGLVTNYRICPEVLLKVSFERTIRLPTATELFGDELLEVGTITLNEENSRNINFNVGYSPSFGVDSEHTIYLDAGFIYRDTRDYIRRQIEQRYGGAYYTNHGQVRNIGVDLEARYLHKNNFSLGGTVTYQDIRNMEQYSPTGQKLIYYKDRMPNVPYLFGNADASYQFTNVWGKDNMFTVSYFLNYVHEFFRQWESEGSSNSKKIIPTQLSQDLNVIYSLNNGKYNISLEVRNFTDEILYDNYSLQKPGRSFSARFRYFFSKSKN